MTIKLFHPLCARAGWALQTMALAFCATSFQATAQEGDENPADEQKIVLTKELPNEAGTVEIVKVGQEPAVATIKLAGQDPVEQLHRMAGRVKVVHFKDYVFDENGYRRFVSLGKGYVDLKACYAAACELDIPYIAYEQDNDWTDGDPFRAVEESWAFMQSLQA